MKQRQRSSGNNKKYWARIERPADILKQPFQDLLRVADRMLFRVLGRVVHGSAPRRAPEQPARILVIRRNRLGDAICVLPLIERLKANYPRARVAVVGNPYNAPVFRLAPHVDDVYELPERYWGNRWFLFAHPVMRAIRKARFDVTIVASLTPSSHGARLALYSDGRFRVGPVSSKGSLYDLVFHGRVPIPSLTKVHQVERVAELAERAGMQVGGELPPVRLALARPSVPAKVGHVYLCPDVNRPESAWPVENYERLIDMLRQRHPDWRVSVLVPRESARHAALRSRGAELVVTSTFRDFVDQIKQASLVVCSEGGTSHLAPALGVPTVVLSGVSIVRTWAPWSPLAKVIERTGAVAEISPGEVVRHLEALHAHSAPSAP